MRAMRVFVRPAGRWAALAVLSSTALFFFAAVLAACGGTARPAPSASAGAATTAPATGTPSNAAFPMTVTDSGGHALTLRAPARAIVSHSPGATEILFAIGAGGQVVAADEFSDFPAAAKALRRVKYTDPSPEAELALQTDLVILATNQKAQIETFRGLGLPVFYNREPEGVDGVLDNVRLLGRMTGHTVEAEALATQMRTRIDAVTARLGDVQQGPKVFYELSDSLYTAAPNTFIGGMLSTLKARNIALGAASQFPQLTAEAVIAGAPDVILLADHDYGGTPPQVRARPGWSAIPAVKNDRMYAVDADVVNRPGPRIVEGIEMMAKLLYPERFP
ncbi:MAG: helical backbone metal receptor [Dehalococcoidia bacterium]